MSPIDRNLIEALASRPGQPVRDLKRAAAGRVLLATMMRLHNLRIVVGQHSTQYLRQDEHQVHSSAHVWRQDAANVVLCTIELGNLG